MDRAAPTPQERLSADLRQRLEFEELLLGVTASLASAAGAELDRAIGAALERIGSFLGTGRAYVYQLSPDGQRFSATHEFCAPGVPSALDSFRDVPIAHFAWAFERLRKGQPFQVQSADALPPEGAEVAAGMRALGIRSLLAMPLRQGGRLIGGIGFDWYAPAPEWSRGALTLLEVAAEVLSGVLYRERTERELRTTEERLESFVVSAREAVFCYEPEQPFPAELPLAEQAEHLLDARLVVCNESYAALRGSEAPGDLIGGTWRELALSDAPRLRTLIVQLLETGLAVDGDEFEQVLAGGRRRWLRARAQVIVQEGRLVRVWGLLRDVTDDRRAERERSALQAQLLQAQRMESIGLLAGGVAHDFNNLLVVILNYCNMAREDLEHDPRGARESLGHVLEAAHRAADLTRGLLAFSSQRDGTREPLAVDALLTRLLGLLRRMIRESITLDFRPGAAGAHVLGDGSGLEQVLVNLCVNAADAIEDVGRIAIETSVVAHTAEDARRRPWARGARSVCVTVRDSGAGMTPEVCQRIFEPFFTTKEPGKGTGLGLAVVYGIVAQHEGHVEVESQPGRGTVFRVWLPCAEAAPSDAADVRTEGPRGGGEHVLLAEDHELVRDVARAMLSGAGYRVTVARDGAEAVDLFESAPDAFDLVLLDAVMPAMSGRVVYERIRAVRPELPIVVASGYAGGVFPPGFLREREESILSKPYRRDSLLLAVRRALDERR
jgi:signal transduction histidine kinase/ActR/RegA family two-component response regulator